MSLRSCVNVGLAHASFLCVGNTGFVDVFFFVGDLFIGNFKWFLDF